jgi:phospholipase C
LPTGFITSVPSPGRRLRRGRISDVLQGGDRLLARWHLRHRDKEADVKHLPDPHRDLGTEHPEDPIRHIVILMLENHSFDNYLGTLGRGDGLSKDSTGQWSPSNEKLDGGVVRPYRLPSTVQLGGVPTQSWRASHIQYADGANDGFVTSIEETVSEGDPRVAMGFWTEEDLPFYASLARVFPLANRWHCSLLGPTFPNRRFLIAGTANGLIDDVLAGTFDYPKTGTIFDMFDRHGISWANYHHFASWRTVLKRGLGNPGLRATRRLRLALNHILPAMAKSGTDNLQFTADLYPLGLWRCVRHLRHVDRFFVDAEAGTLPAVSIVDPDMRGCSEENPQDIQLGEGFAAAVINAVMDGKGWQNTLLVWLYDEHGGYFDHVPPGPAEPPDDVPPRSLLQAYGPLRWLLQRRGTDWKRLEAGDAGSYGYDTYGFRVPAVVVCPYAKANHVSDVVYDHTSVLKLIAHKWNLPPLTRRAEKANNPMDDMVDLSQNTFGDRPRLAPPTQPWSGPQPGSQTAPNDPAA